MTNHNSLSSPRHERVLTSTIGETRKWLYEEATGATPFTASYLDHMRSLLEYAQETAKKGSYDELSDDIMSLAGAIGEKSEDRLMHQAEANGGNLPTELEGVSPVHDVQDDDISRAVAEFDPSHPDYEGYAAPDTLNVLEIHSTIMKAVNDELGRNNPPQ